MVDKENSGGVGGIVQMFPDEQNGVTATAIDITLAKKITVEELKRLKAIEYTIQFLKNREIKSLDTVQSTYEIFLKQINNGSENK